MENILLAERALLYTLAFDLQAMQPFNELSACFQRLGLSRVSHRDRHEIWHLCKSTYPDFA